MSVVRILFGCIIGSIIGIRASPCLKREYPDGIVCVCTEEYCDLLENVDLKEKDDIVLVSSSLDGLRFEVTRSKHQFRNSFIANSTKYGINIISPNDDTLYQDQTPENLSKFFCMNTYVAVNRSITYQKMVGFGGAFTGAVSFVMDTMPQTLQNHVYKSYFSKREGIGYTMIRMPIGGSDFDFVPWANSESSLYDANLSNFVTLDDRDLKRISQLSDLKIAAGNDEIKFIGAAWSPPPWMKTNNDWTGLGTLKPEYYRTWAQYHLTFLELMADKGVNFWAFSTGNEPLNGHLGWFFIHFMSLGWTPKEQAIWVGDHLGPLLRNSAFKDVKLLGGDDQRFVMPFWFEQMNESHTDAIRYLDGFGVHWYWNDVTPVQLLDETHTRFPDKFILNTESCIGVFPLTFHGPVLGSWERAEQYARSYIEDLTHWVVGWVDWNIVLNEAGGPNYVNGTVDAPIIVNTTGKNEFYKQPMFYAIGHFSRFIVENSTRIDVHSSNDCVLTAGYQRPDNSIAIILFNRDTQDTKIKLRDGNIIIRLTVPGRSIHTLVYY